MFHVAAIFYTLLFPMQGLSQLSRAWKLLNIRTLIISKVLFQYSTPVIQYHVHNVKRGKDKVKSLKNQRKKGIILSSPFFTSVILPLASITSAFPVDRSFVPAIATAFACRWRYSDRFSVNLKAVH